MVSLAYPPVSLIHKDTCTFRIDCRVSMPDNYSLLKSHRNERRSDEILGALILLSISKIIELFNQDRYSDARLLTNFVPERNFKRESLASAQLIL